jgi:hypothetical protein
MLKDKISLKYLESVSPSSEYHCIKTIRERSQTVNHNQSEGSYFLAHFVDFKVSFCMEASNKKLDMKIKFFDVIAASG